MADTDTSTRKVVDHDNDDQEERQDLSAADQQELLAFIEKRNWFELKLEHLQSLPPVFPFLDPVLESSPGSSDVYRRQQKSTWTFPDKAQVESWILERDALEEEVEAFDGGDMERMKEKTRQVTRVPLTQPSTDLVEVTLDLILLIDRLLKILQHRGSVLDLMTLRIQWDDLRWQVMLEIKKVRREIDELVRGRGRWEPPTAADQVVNNGMESLSIRDKSQLDLPSLHPTSESSYQTPPRRSLPLPLSVSGTSLSDLVPSSPTSIHTPGSPHRSTQTPQRSLLLPILYSQLVTLSTKHRHLTDGILTRSGAVIDRMIDAAVTLKGLGGVQGPDEDENKSGAVPEELIDLQEQLETDVKEVGSRVVWCRRLEDQWKRADAYHASCTKSRDVSRSVLGSLLLPPTMDICSHLEQMVSTASMALPVALDASFPRPTHAVFPDINEHNEAVVDILEISHAQASTALDLARQGLAFYKALLASRSGLSEHDTTLTSLIESARLSLERIRTGTAIAPRPHIDDLDESENRAWLGIVPTLISEADKICNNAGTASQRATVAVIRHRKERVIPRLLREHIEDAPDGLPDQVDTSAHTLRALSEELRQAMTTLRQDADIHDRAHQVKGQVTEIDTRVDEIKSIISASIVTSAWPSANDSVFDHSTLDDIKVRFGTTRQSMTDLDKVLSSYSRTLPSVRPQLLSYVQSAEISVLAVQRQAGSLERVRQQAEVTRTIEQEAKGWTEGLENLRLRLKETTFGDDLKTIQALITDWSDSLPKRAIFVSNAGSATTAAWKRADGDASPTSTGPPELDAQPPFQQTEPISPPPTPGLPAALDLDALDQRVRGHINQLSAALVAAVLNLHTEREGYDRARTQDDESLAQLKKSEAALREVVERATSTVETYRGKMANSNLGRNALSQIEIELNDIVTTLLAQGSTTREETAEAIKRVEVAVESMRALQDDTSTAEIGLRRSKTLIETYGVVSSDVRKLQEDIQSAIQRWDDDQVEVLKSLRPRLAALDLQRLVNPTPDDLLADPLLRRLPDPDGAQAVRETLASIRTDAQNLEGTSDEVKSFKCDLEGAEGLVPRLDSLVEFHGSIKRADAALSKLLDALDENNTTGPALEDASHAIESMRTQSSSLSTDPRVSSELRGVLRTYSELESLAKNPNLADDDISDTFSVAESSISTLSRPRAPRIPSSLSLARTGSSMTNRSTSQPGLGPGPATFHLSTEASRARTVSEASNGSRLDKLRGGSGGSGSGGSGLPRLRKDSLSPSTTPKAGPRNSTSPSKSSTPSGIPRSTRRSLPNQLTSTSPPKEGTDNEYVPNPKSKLDIAVSKVVNKLNVNVPIVPLGLNSPDEWKDQSGKYWIGAEGRAKLCFCRILRSRTVMVRVGGGWVELSKFLLDHFADAIGSWHTPIDATSLQTPEASRFGWRSTSLSSPTKANTPVPGSHFLTPSQIPVASASSTSARSTPPSTQANVTSITSPSHNITPLGSEGTPIIIRGGRSVPASGSSVVMFTPPRQQQQQSYHSMSMSPTSPGESVSPLVPLHFLKKASESPSVRDKEREALRMTRPRVQSRENSVGL